MLRMTLKLHESILFESSSHWVIYLVSQTLIFVEACSITQYSVVQNNVEHFREVQCRVVGCGLFYLEGNVVERYAVQ